MRRSIPAMLAVMALLLTFAAPAAAAKPVGGCPNGGFELMTYQQFRTLSLSVGVPESLLGAEHEAAVGAIDKNDDGMICVRDQPDTPGTLGGWIFNVIDNTARAER